MRCIVGDVGDGDLLTVGCGLLDGRNRLILGTGDAAADVLRIFLQHEHILAVFFQSNRVCLDVLERNEEIESISLVQYVK